MKSTSDYLYYKKGVFFFLMLSIGGSMMGQKLPEKKKDTLKSKDIDEVVMVGYGKQKKINVTGAVSTIGPEVLEDRPVTNVARAIQGASPGLSVTRSSGRPGSESINVEVRGATTVNGATPPLYVIDGVVASQEAFTALNPNDIAGISVLRDGGAAAIYGSRAAGGVLIVTTKTGRKGKMKISYSSSMAIQRPMNLPKRVSLLQEAEYANLARANSGLQPEYSEIDLDYIRRGIEYVTDPSNPNRYITYNQKSIPDMVLRKTYNMYQNNIDFSGGSEKITYMASIGNLQQDGIFKVGEDDFTRWNYRLNLNAQVNDYISIDLRSSYASEYHRRAVDGGYGLEAGGNGIFRQLYTARQRFPVYTEDGRYYIAGTSSIFGYALLKDGGFNRRTVNTLSNIGTITLKNLAKGLEFKAIYGRENLDFNETNFRRTVNFYDKGPAVIGRQNSPNSYQVERRLQLTENFQFLADYTLKLNKHNFHVLGGFQYENTRRDWLTARTSNLYVNENPSLNFTGDQRNKTNSQYIDELALQAFFGRFNYNFNEKYIFEATVRSDESSRLAPGKRIKVFPSFSFAWNMQKEGWFEGSLGFITELKPRVTWAKVGSQAGIGYYDFMRNLSSGNNIIVGIDRTTFVYQSGIPSPNLAWETIETRNIGVDFSLFNNKLSGTFDYYNKFNRNMLVGINLPATVGISTPIVNAGELKVWGWEASLQYKGKIGQDFKYSVTANVSDSDNRVIRYDGGRDVVKQGLNQVVRDRGIFDLIEGYSLNTIWGYKTNGYIQNAEQLANAPRIPGTMPGIGDILYIDQNGDGKIDVGGGRLGDRGDLVNLGNTNPRYLFGLNMFMSWKNIDFSFFVQGVGKRNIMPSSELIFPQQQPWYQPLSIHMDYWRPDNPNAAFPRPMVNGRQNNVPSDKWVVNAAYARLKNVQVGYSLPQSALKGMPISRLRIYVTGEDLLTVSKLGVFKGVIDPEQPYNGINYPFSSSVALGVNVDF
ncbi:TonB-dependent receptor [Chryseobacterium piperi]|uniref:TonB-dependent receptor n=1 Tax=Chryseobacterium piperi TaxID=558152 RepID=A0A086B9N9_9FLAO|nr:SusC/RagA family TonB-linked outer membrane protein [Chryseobacterium piperi]KFF25653.1 TonB-dependent receptor [Chryseobacterium piperi]